MVKVGSKARAENSIIPVLLAFVTTEAARLPVAASDEEITDLALLLPRVLAAIIKKFSGLGALKQKVEPDDETADIPYNYYIYHGPDWYLRIIPRLIHRAGFELGTGLSVNIVDPLTAASEYKQLLTGTS